MTALTPTWVVLSRVRDELAAEFETLLRDRIGPAAAAARLPGPWQAHRAGSAEGTTTFVFLFQGGTLEEWDLAGPAFAEVVGVDEARALDGRIAELLAEDQQVLPLTQVC